MVGALVLLLACQLVGELVTRLLGLPVPGPVLGTILLFLTLLVRGSIPGTLRDTSRILLQNLSLLFVPAGVGIIQHVERIRDEWPGITVVLVGSTLVTLAVTALVFRWVARLTGAAAPTAEDGHNSQPDN